MVESGGGVAELDGRPHDLAARDVVWVPRGTAHALRPGPHGLRVWAFAYGAGSPPVWLGPALERCAGPGGAGADQADAPPQEPGGEAPAGRPV